MFWSSNSTRPVLPGTVLPSQPVPDHIERPAYACGEEPLADPGGCRDAQTIDRMRRAGRLARTVLERVAAEAVPGVTTFELDQLAQEWVVEAGAYPSTIGYRTFEKALCTSVNEIACHGIPDDRPLASGDIVSLDLTVWLDGVHGDTCLTVPVGAVDRDSARLIRATEASLEAGIQAVRPGVQLRAIGAATDRVARDRGFTVIEMFTGHGIGFGFHAEPQSVFHVDQPDATLVLEEGMTFTIEPILTPGTGQIVIWDDGWTAATRDLARCAQAEHTIVVTGDGAEILTMAG